MDALYVDPHDLVRQVQQWPFEVTLGVLILASLALWIVGRESGDRLFVRKVSGVVLAVFSLWGAYFCVDSILFRLKFTGSLFSEAGPLIIFFTVTSLASGAWLVIVGICRAVALFRKGGDDPPRRARARRWAKVTLALAAAWFICRVLVFSAMEVYFYMSTFWLLLLGFYGAGDSITSLLKRKKHKKHIVGLIVGALSVSIGIFAFIGVFYRAAFGESWYMVGQQLLVSLAYMVIGTLQIVRRLRIVQLAFSVLAIFLVIWRVSYCVYRQVPEFQDRMNRLVEIARAQGCGRYERMLYYGQKSDRLDLVEISDYVKEGAPDCEKIPTDIPVRRDGVVLYHWHVMPEDDLVLQLGTGFYDGLKWGSSQGLLLAVEKDVQWKTLVPLVDLARQYGNHRLFFLFKKRIFAYKPIYDMVPEHRLKSEIEEIMKREGRNAVISCAKILNQLDAYCPQFFRIFQTSIYADRFEYLEIYSSILPQAAAKCFGDIDLVTVLNLIRCVFQFELLYVAGVPIAGPDEPWAKEISLPADMPWEQAHKHILKAIVEPRHPDPPPPPLRLVVEK